MHKINIQDAKTHLSRLVEEALEGETVILAKAGKPMVRLVPVGSAGCARTLGVLKGRVEEAPDCWEPDAEIERLFSGEEREDTPA